MIIKNMKVSTTFGYEGRAIIEYSPGECRRIRWPRSRRDRKTGPAAGNGVQNAGRDDSAEDLDGDVGNHVAPGEPSGPPPSPTVTAGFRWQPEM